jgi:hypothetical protein
MRCHPVLGETLRCRLKQTVRARRQPLARALPQVGWPARPTICRLLHHQATVRHHRPSQSCSLRLARAPLAGPSCRSCLTTTKQRMPVAIWGRQRRRTAQHCPTLPSRQQPWSAPRHPHLRQATQWQRWERLLGHPQSTLCGIRRRGTAAGGTVAGMRPSALSLPRWASAKPPWARTRSRREMVIGTRPLRRARRRPRQRTMPVMAPCRRAEWWWLWKTTRPCGPCGGTCTAWRDEVSMLCVCGGGRGGEGGGVCCERRAVSRLPGWSL